ncbi:hypothetical protein [Psychroflexus aestuariivivens]|uniref:hypothetical protein n=1 Tax=Psychroflexus aestuariivivens TaxID=1795040 RepID=UPI000FD821F5|nr:hypothetical protein [Psychroflexus aestuariivivens]
MGQVNPAYNNRAEYELYQKGYGSMIISEPIGWKTDDKEMARNEDYDGIFPKFSNNLKFYGDAVDFIQAVKDIFDINAEIRLSKKEKHPYEDTWYLSYTGYLDMSTYTYEDNKISLKFNSGGLEQELKNRNNKKIEIERTNTLDGQPIPDLETSKVKLEGRRIFLRSKWEMDQDNNDFSLTTSYNWDVFDGGSDIIQSKKISLPLKLEQNSHQNLAQTPTTFFSTVMNQGDLNQMLMFDFSRERTLNVSFKDIGFKPRITEFDVNWAYIAIQINVYENGFDFDHKSTTTIYAATKNYSSSNLNYNNPDDLEQISNQWVDVNDQSFDITLLEGESFEVAILIRGALERQLVNRSRYYVDFDNFLGKVTVEEDSEFQTTFTKSLLAHELGERLSHIITGRTNIFKSEVLGRTAIGYEKNGMASMTALSHGFWIRGFEKDASDEENKYKPFTTTWKDYIESLQAVWNLGLGIENDGKKEILRIEDKKYFYQKTVTIKLPYQVKNVKRSVAKKKYYSGIEIGYEKGGEYEQAMGLDEYNGTSTFITPVKTIDNDFVKKSKYSADSYGREFTRRKSKTLFPTEDTDRDNDIHLMDVKPTELGHFKMRKWQDDFDEEPTGIYSPETATNLRLTPFCMLKRHGWIIRASVSKFPDEWIRYTSSTANSRLKTKMSINPDHTYVNGQEYAENDDIISNELERERFVPEWIEFEHVVEFETARDLEGYTTILGKRIPNKYGLIEFINEFGDKETGFLFNVKPNEKGKWKILKASK